MPDLSGMGYAEAREALAELGLFISSGGTGGLDGGRVVSGQDAAAGSAAASGSVITVTLCDNGEELLGIY